MAEHASDGGHDRDSARGIRVTIVEGDVEPVDARFQSAFRIGRGPECDVTVPHHLVSRVHAEVVRQKGRWSVHDLGSTNGTFVNDDRVEMAALESGSLVRLGRGGPVLAIEIDGVVAPDRPRLVDQPSLRAAAVPLRDRPGDARRGRRPGDWREPDGQRAGDGDERSRKRERPADDERPRQRERPGDERSERGRSGDDRYDRERGRAKPAAHAPEAVRDRKAVDDARRKYILTGDDQPAGEHTQVIRMAVREAQERQRRRFTVALAVLSVAAVFVASFATYKWRHGHTMEQRIEEVTGELGKTRGEVAKQRELAEQVFYGMKDFDVQITQLRMAVEGAADKSLTAQLRELEKKRQKLAVQYDGYVDSLGVYANLTQQERLVYRVARVFNESEFGMPGPFLGMVMDMVHHYWLSAAGRSRFRQALENAEAKGYTRRIVRVLRESGLPPQLLFMALQESNLNPHAIGPPTRWGRAKGMWQLIPATARRFGLQPGVRADEPVVDAQDERLDFAKATGAAARYLQSIYGTLAQASGLLVVASYNWGEHRVANKLENLSGPQSIPDEALAGIPEDTRSRSYWRFLSEYRDRMPEETKDYVIKIFAAAVIGENPRLFGLDMEGPLGALEEVEP